VDQIPPLTNLHRTLEEMSISGRFTGADAGAPAASPFVVELVAEARERLVRTYEGRWQEVADHQLKEVLVKETPDELKRLGSMISIPKELFEEGPDPIDITGLESAGGAVSSDTGGGIFRFRFSSNTSISIYFDFALIRRFRFSSTLRGARRLGGGPRRRHGALHGVLLRGRARGRAPGRGPRLAS